MVVLLGADGSGKSSVATHLVRLYERSHGSVKRYHWRPGFLPYWRSDGQDQENLGAMHHAYPHDRRPRSGVVAWALFFYIVADFALGYLFLIRPMLRAGTPIIYERYYYDLMLDQARYALSIPQWLRNLGAFVIPTPDLTIFLDGPADVLRARKAELSIDEIDRQRTAVNTHLCRLRGFRVMNVSTVSAEQLALAIHAAA